MNTKKDNLYKNIGVGLLIVNAFLFLRNIFYLFVAIVIPEFQSLMLKLAGSPNEVMGVYIWGICETLFYLWGIIISILLIKRNKNNRQLFIWVCTFAGVKFIIFIAGIIFGEKYIFDLLTAVFIFVFLIIGKNKLAKLLKNR